MRGLVGEEGHLREHDAEGRRDQQLKQAVAEQDEPGDATGPGHEQRGADQRVEHGSTPQQPQLLHDPRDLRVGPRDGWEALRRRVRLTDGAES